MISIPQMIRDRNRPKYNIRIQYKNHVSLLMILKLWQGSERWLISTSCCVGQSHSAGAGRSKMAFTMCLVLQLGWRDWTETGWTFCPLPLPHTPPSSLFFLCLLVTHLSPSPTINLSLFTWTLHLSVMQCEFLYTVADMSQEGEPNPPGLLRPTVSTAQPQLLPLVKARHSSPGSKKGKQTLTLDWRTFMCIHCPIAHVYLCRQPTRINLLLL